MRVLVTGAAGFIGFHTARALLARGDEVVGLDNLNAYYDPKLKTDRLAILEPHANFHFRELDIADRAAMQKLFDGERFQRAPGQETAPTLPFAQATAPPVSGSKNSSPCKPACVVPTAAPGTVNKPTRRCANT